MSADPARRRRPKPARKLFAGLALILALATGATALAARPSVETFESTITDNLLGSCNSFDIIENADITGRVTTFFDNADTPVRIQIYATYRGTMTNSVTGKTVADGPDARTYVDDLNGTLAIHGLVFSINIPGEGVAVLDVGNVIFHPDGSVTVDGKHQVVAEGIGALCGALDR